MLLRKLKNCIFPLMKKSPHIGIILLVFTQFLLAIGNYQDYGLHWDDYSTRVIGANNALLANQRLDYFLISEDKVKELAESKMSRPDKSDYLSLDSLENYELSQYGAFFELVLMGIEWVSGLDSFHSIFYARHLTVHLFYLVGIVFFYFLLFQQFHNWKISLLGALILLLCPRIFAHSFFNTKDIPFLTACILATFSFFQLAKSPGYRNALLHAFFCAIAIDTRIIGLVFPGLSLVLYFNLMVGTKKWKYFLLQGGFYLLVTGLLVILFWPYLWQNPLGHILFTLESMSKYPWYGSLVFMGQLYQPIDFLPWYYFPVWFVISIPLFYFLGFFLFFVQLFRQSPNSLLVPGSPLQFQVFALALFFLPWGVAIIRQSVLLDDWRHFYFVYPFFVIMVITGFHWMKTRFSIADKLFYLGIAIPLIWIMFKMIQLHPYQYIYTNALVNKPIAEQFEVDYWGLSYKNGLEFLVQHEPKGLLKVAIAEEPGETNALVLKQTDRERINFVTLEEATYFMTAYREVLDRKDYLEKKGIRPDQELYQVKVGREVLLSVFKLK